MNNGCICCTVRGDLIRIPRAYVVLEIQFVHLFLLYKGFPYIVISLPLSHE
ncbi:hypothetical protein BMMGA3_02155 [Bacillus methanolicus MGA3]|uniref:Uncharacterized protein n=1 Tax=Bacillus methanolicus (strain MGA3 / ATCC 53907) TaxID=796606 RepID=A0A068LMD8_BACMM|nr:hypothetical protein BMMGA3_02155 [Bacillus methanolicus MGA3]